MRDQFHDLDLGQIEYPAEIPVHVDGPDEGTQAIGNAGLSRRADGHLWAEFYLSELDGGVLETHTFFAVALTESLEDGTITISHLGLTDRNIDPEIRPVSVY